MFRCRLIRTVVNLSLIVAMIMQPGMVLVFANDCGTRCATTFMCDGCGCCEVSTPIEKCCCCGGGSKEESTVSCCMRSSESSVAEHSMLEDDEVDSGDTLQLRVFVISTTDPIVVDELSAPGTAEVASGCHCGFQSQPVGDSTPRRTIEQRDSVAIRFANLAMIFGDAVPRPPRAVGTEDATSPPHFSQIHLCIWRL